MSFYLTENSWLLQPTRVVLVDKKLKDIKPNQLRDARKLSYHNTHTYLVTCYSIVDIKKFFKVA